MNVHDAGRRLLFSDKQIMADLIRGFITEPWAEDLDLETLERVDGSFVADQLQKRESDVIWRVQFRGSWLYIYLLVEFQSRVDSMMAVRLMVYVGLLYQRLVREKQLKANEPLPPVMPIVLYNGKTPWRAAREVRDLIADCPESLDKYCPRMQYFLLEEHAQRPEQLAGMQNLVALVFRFEQCRSPEDLRELIQALKDWTLVPQHAESVRLLVEWVGHVLRRRGTDPVTTARLNDVQEYGAMLEERVKEWEQELFEKGRAEGKREGKLEGMAEGKAEGKAEALSQLLVDKFGEIPEAYRRRIKHADLPHLTEWMRRVLSAESIDDVFGV